MSQISQAVQRQQQNGRTSLHHVIAEMQGEIARALPKHMDADRMARLALTVVRRTPKLADTTPASFAGALLTASALGLEPGVNGEAYLVPYKGETQLIIGYQGMCKLFFQHPLAASLDAEAVYERDEFDYAKGTDPYLRHKPAMGEDRGQIVAYYGVAKLSTGATHFIVLSPADVKALRQGKVGSNGGIPDPMRWMERKTVIRQLLKTLPKSTTLAHAIDADEQMGSKLRKELPAAPVSPSAPSPAGAIAQSEYGPVDTVNGDIIDAEPEWQDGEPA